MTDATASDFNAALLVEDAQALYDSAPCGYLSTLPGGTIVKANRTFLTLTGYLETELVGRMTFADVLTGGGRIYHETHLAPMLNMHGSVHEIALEIVRADGNRLPVLVNAVMERDAAGHPRAIRTAVFDASERRHYERELLQAKEAAEAAEAAARRLATTLQQTLIPPDAPKIDGLQVAAAYRPARDGTEVGGDFYDIFEVARDDWVIVVGDVCGKGVDAAVITAVARHTIRAASVPNPAPSSALRFLNEVLLRHESDRFCTIVILRLRRSDGVWVATVTCGGHPLPIHARAGGVHTEVGKYGSLIGVMTDPEFHDVDVPLEHGDTIVLYTDGVTEGRATDGEFFGEERLNESIGDRTDASSSVRDVLQAALDFQSGNTVDDIVIVSISVP